MKTCTLCKTNKPLDEFSWKNKTKNIKYSRCKPCYRAIRNKSYAINKTTELKTIRTYRKRRRKELKEWLNNYKKNLCCIKCGENRAPCLQFHHRDPSSKDIEVSIAINNRWALKRIQAEMAKCDVLCANCHLLLHANFS